MYGAHGKEKGEEGGRGIHHWSYIEIQKRDLEQIGFGLVWFEKGVQGVSRALMPFICGFAGPPSFLPMCACE